MKPKPGAHKPQPTPQKIVIDGFINKSVYSVYHGQLLEEGIDCAVKVFPSKQGKVSDEYLREKKLRFLSHKNIIKYFECVDNQKFLLESKQFKGSCIAMEYSSYPDFGTICKETDIRLDETLVRTYFH